MIRAIFIDYTGTMVREDDPGTMELLKLFMEHSDLKEPKEALGVVWGLVKKIEAECWQDTFIKKDEMVERILAVCSRDYGLDYDHEKLHRIWSGIWVHAPLFDDVRPFFERETRPIYVLTNDDLIYIEQSMAEKDLHPAGIVSAELVRACKPHREILEKGLSMAGVRPEEGLLIGDSQSSDVVCARAAGVMPVLLDRSGKKSSSEELYVIHSLLDPLPEVP